MVLKIVDLETDFVEIEMLPFSGEVLLNDCLSLSSKFLLCICLFPYSGTYENTKPKSSRVDVFFTQE